MKKNIFKENRKIRYKAQKNPEQKLETWKGTWGKKATKVVVLGNFCHLKTT